MEAVSGIKTKTLVIMALMIALSFVGANIRIFGSIAFDSLPAFLAALMFGPVIGAVIGFIGHLLTAILSGFPLSMPVHIVIAISMAITMLGFGHTYKLLSKTPMIGRLTITGIVGVILNAPFSLAMSMGVMMLLAGREVALGMLALLPILVLASAANVLLSILLYKALDKVRND